MSNTPPENGSPIRLIVTIVLIVIGLALVFFFGRAFWRDYMRLQQRGLQPGVTDVEAIRGWMTLPYIAQAYGVPEAELFEALDIPQAENRGLSIKQLADKYGKDPAVIREVVQTVVRRYVPTDVPTPGATP